MALMNLVHRGQIFPRKAYRRTFDSLIEQLPERAACKIIVELLSLAHERGCEAELADALTEDLEARRLPDLARLRARFSPDPASLPVVSVQLPSLAVYDTLLTEAGVDRTARLTMIAALACGKMFRDAGG